MYSKLPNEYTGPFKDVLPEYVDYRRSLGHGYGGWVFIRLRHMDLFFKQHGVVGVEITEEMFNLWSAKRDGESEKTQWLRINMLVLFSKYLAVRGYSNIYVGELPRKAPQNDFVPYIFTYGEISAITTVFKKRTEANPDNYVNASVAVLFSLYYSCGLRRSECTKLKIGDVDFQSGRIRILDSKNRKSRMVVVSETMRLQMVKYRERFRLGGNESDYLFPDKYGAPFCAITLYRVYHGVLKEAGVHPRESGQLPRIHDLRHTFCVHVLESLVAKGFDLYSAFPRLVAYLGHKSLTETEYYLRLVDQNFKSVTELCRNYSPGVFPKVGDSVGE